MLPSEDRRFEAGEWLSSNPNPYAFAGNRFGSTQAALAFVEQLYREGAVIVYVVDPLAEEWRIASEGGPYADSLIVELPDDRTRRAALFKLYNAEVEREGFEPVFDVGQHFLSFWWD